MKTPDIAATAFRNTLRSRLRTALTVLAVSIGALTLTLTTALGNGINTFMADTVASVGVDDVMTVMRTPEQQEMGSGPVEYDPDRTAAAAAAAAAGATGAGMGGGGMGIDPLTAEDLDEIAAIDGALRVEPMTFVAVDYVQHGDGTRYQIDVAQFLPGMHAELAAGEQIDLDAPEPQVILPISFVEPLGLSDGVTGASGEDLKAAAAGAVGEQVAFAVMDATGTQHHVRATVVGVAQPGLVAASGAIPNEALLAELHTLARTGVPEGTPEMVFAASVWFDADAGADHLEALQSRMEDAGFSAFTLDDTLGVITSVIDTVVLVLNGFALIALVAASIGIINTLFMAVQERTREIGLMKAMGLSSARVFSLFSLEAVTLGLLGSALGVGAAVVIGEVVQGALADTLLADLPGLVLLRFDPVTTAVVVVGIMAVAFLAGTLPALRAAKADPIESLRYE